MSARPDADTTPQPGDTHGRWTVVRRATPEMRDGCMRARVRCRCACGYEATVWVGDLQRGRSLGCRFASCRNRAQAQKRLEVVFDREIAEAIVDLATRREQSVRSFISEAWAEFGDRAASVRQRCTPRRGVSEKQLPLQFEGLDGEA